LFFFFFQAEDGIRDFCLSRGLGVCIRDRDNGVTAIRGQYSSDSGPSTQLAYLGIIATNDFHLNIQGTNNTAVLFANARLYGFRARADASIYAALVQSELLSA